MTEAFKRLDAKAKDQFKRFTPVHRLQNRVFHLKIKWMSRVCIPQRMQKDPLYRIIKIQLVRFKR
ncbi:hypothetical protein H5410_064448 [Solanum commersonii]|uniref:Uncharacterized protein n=1 Tax=Solanum commersonii TaxID=4109 RepID=A0A9J5VZG6_SOLCO|nr:hypothetical protein H5410_064448 [Solanum commersonii]